jgi:[CysO sulfur-carrier protein]-thiocarboxylate-dependent cysteine synthase
MKVLDGVRSLIGNTPMVDVSCLSPNPQVRLLAKCEYLNPFGSIKDRSALSMLDAAWASGQLTPGQRILEPSSGNTGIALAALGRLAGHPVTVVAPASISSERQATLAAFGAEIVLTDGAQGSNGAIAVARELSQANPNWFCPFQYGNDANPIAHYQGTGPEIWKQTEGTVTHFVAGLGTGGTLAGIGRYLREHNPDVVIVAVEPPLGETVDGLRNVDDGFIPPVFERWGGFDLLNRRRIVRPETSVAATRRLVAETGIFAGPSSGANLAGALRIASEIDTGVVVFVVCDGGWKYLSTGAYSADIERAADALEHTLYF